MLYCRCLTCVLFEFETGEREELCDLIDNIADAVELNVQDYQDGIASRWREW